MMLARRTYSHLKTCTDDSDRFWVISLLNTAAGSRKTETLSSCFICNITNKNIYSNKKQRDYLTEHVQAGES